MGLGTNADGKYPDLAGLPKHYNVRSFDSAQGVCDAIDISRLIAILLTPNFVGILHIRSAVADFIVFCRCDHDIHIFASACDLEERRACHCVSHDGFMYLHRR